MRNVTQAEISALVTAAKLASGNAYCPYSNFRVGAAVLAEDGAIFSGCNVENASYGLTSCAERNAVFHAVAGGMKSIRAAAIYTPTANPTAPCGACRQVLNEFGPGAMIICACDDPGRLEMALFDLLPQAFGPGNLAP